MAIRRHGRHIRSWQQFILSVNWICKQNKKLDLDSGSKQQTLYWQKDFGEAYYYGVVPTIGYYNGNIYFCYKEEGGGYSIHSKNINNTASSKPKAIVNVTAITQAPFAVEEQLTSNNQSSDYGFMRPDELTIKFPLSKNVERWGVINSDKVRLRSSASRYSKVISTFDRQKVWVFAEVMNEDILWYYIDIRSTTDSNTESTYGFMMAEFINLE